MPLINRVRGAKKLVSIIILTAPTTTTYKYGTAFDPTGMVIQAIYSNGKTETITDYTYSPTGALTHSTSAITISYTEKRITATVQQEITVTPILSSITITTQPTTKTYEYGDTFSTSGMVVTATYSDNSIKTITNYTYTPTSTLTTLGSKTVTVSYTEDGITKTATTSITVERKSVAVPSQSGTLTYNGSAQSPSWTGYDTTYMTMSGTTSSTNAATYYTTFTPKANYRWTDGTTAGKSVPWTIDRLAVTIPTLATTSYTYDNSTKTPTQNNYNSTYMTRSGTSSATDAGTYTITYAVRSNYKWSDGTTTDKSVSWKIDTRSVALPSQSGTLTYTGSSQSPTWSNYDSAYMTRSGTTSGTNAGSYTATFTLDTDNCYWSDGTTTAARNVTWTINRKSISTTPSQSGTLTYNGSSQSPIWSNYNTTYMTISGTTSAVDAGSYTAKFTPTNNYKWSNGSTSAKSVTWKINKANASISLSSYNVSLTNANPTAKVTYTINAGAGTPSATSNKTSLVAVSRSGTTFIIKQGSGSLPLSGSTTITVKLAASTNYNQVTATINVSIDIKAVPTYQGTAEALSVARYTLAGATAGDSYAIFVGGNNAGNTLGSSNIKNTVDTYDTGLTHNTKPLTYPKQLRLIGAGSIGNYAVFAGGRSTSNLSSSTLVVSYDTGLTEATQTALNPSSGSYGRAQIMVASNGTYLIMAGGWYNSAEKDIDVYTSSLTKYTTDIRLEDAHRWGGAARAGSTGNYAVFTGGGSSLTETVDTGLTKGNAPENSHTSALGITGTTLGDYALFAGDSTTITYYNKNLTKNIISNGLSISRTNLASTTLKNQVAIFGGGTYSNAVDMIDSSLTKLTPTTLSVARMDLAAASVGSYALFAGGNTSFYSSEYGTPNSTVDVYKI